MDRTLSFDEGLVSYDINGKAKASFNPTDANFTDRFYETMEELDRSQDEMSAQAQNLSDDPKAMFSFISEKDAKMRASIDALLGEGVADALFGSMNCYAMANGLPVWMNLMFAIADEINDSLEAERGKTDGRVKAYNRKYDKLLAKYKPAAPDRQSHK